MTEEKCNSDQWWNNYKCRCECKKRHVCEKDYIWNPVTCSCKNGKYLASIMDDSSFMSDEIIESYDEETKTIPTNFNEEKVTCKISIFYLHCIIDSCEYLLLFDTISRKTKTFVTISQHK